MDHLDDVFSITEHPFQFQASLSLVKCFFFRTGSNHCIVNFLLKFETLLHHHRGFQDLAEVLRNNKTLKYLQVSNNKPEDTGVKLLADAKNIPTAT